MGIFDTYAHHDVAVQIKVNQTFVTYRPGDACPLPDGVYLGNEGAVTVHHGRVVAVTDKVFSKWGDRLSPSDLIHKRNPVVQALETLTCECCYQVRTSLPFHSDRYGVTYCQQCYDVGCSIGADGGGCSL